LDKKERFLEKYIRQGALKSHQRYKHEEGTHL